MRLYSLCCVLALTSVALLVGASDAAAASARRLSGRATAGTPQATGFAYAKRCLNETGEEFSGGAMRYVGEQGEACVNGQWTFPEDSHPDNEATLAAQLTCFGTGPKDKSQQYESGLLHSLPSGKLERCDDGKWVPVAKTAERSPLRSARRDLPRLSPRGESR